MMNFLPQQMHTRATVAQPAHAQSHRQAVLPGDLPRRFLPRSYGLAHAVTTGLFLLVYLVWFSVASPAQITNPIRPVVKSPTNPPVAIRAPAAVPVAPQDPLVNLMMQQPPIDYESPVVAEAVFDPPVVPVGSRGTYRLTLNAMNVSIKLPPSLPTPTGLELTPGGRSETYIPGPNKLQPKSMINYRVMAAKAGSYTIPAFTINVYDKPVTVPAARVVFVERNSALAREAPKLVVELPAGDFFVGQAIPIKVVLSSPNDNSVLGLSQVQVKGEAFLTEMMGYRQRRDLITNKGTIYQAFIHELVVMPIREGDNILQAQAQAVVSIGNVAQPGRSAIQTVLIDADPITVPTKPLPKAGKLPGFTGAIGEFQLLPSRLSATNAAAGDPITLTVTLKGAGNFARFTPPRLVGVRNWQVFTPSFDTEPIAASPAQMMRSFSYTMIPLSDQVKATPPIPFCYYNARDKVYVDLTIPPVLIQVTPAAGGKTVSLTDQGASRDSVELDEPVARDKELVMTGLADTPGRSAFSLEPLQQQAWFLGMGLLPGVALAGLYYWDRRRRYMAGHPEVQRKCRARRALRQQLRQLRQAAAVHDANAYVQAAVSALRAICAPPSAANPEALVCDDVLAELTVAARQGAEGQMVRTLFAAADALQFQGRAPEDQVVFRMQPALEQLLGQLKDRL